MKKILVAFLLIASQSHASDLTVTADLVLKGKKDSVSLTPGKYKIEAQVKSKSVELSIEGQTVTFKKGSNSVWPKNKEGQIFIPAKDSKQSADFNANYSDKVTSVGNTQWIQQSCTVLITGQQCSGNGMGGVICWPVTTTRPGWQSVQVKTNNRTEALNAELLVSGQAVATFNHSRNYEERVILSEGFCF